MQTENLILDDSCERQIVEEVGEVLPHVGVAVLAEALVVEAVDLGDLSALVVASQDSDSLLEAHFETDEQRDRLDTVVAAVNVVPHEQIVSIRTAPTNLEQLHEVVELAVDVAADGHWAFYGLHVHFRLEDLFSLNIFGTKLFI